MPFSDFERTLHEVAETLRNSSGSGCSLLIGAGCSATANIPLAGGIVQEIATRYPRAYERAQTKTYPHCMAQLAYNQRNDLLAPHIDGAKINWAHVAIAQLMKERYVTRILTTNFDPLIVKACATVGIFPAIYDLAASQQFRAERVYEPSVFYLHGQRAGFVTLNTEAEVQRHKETLRPVFEDAGRGRSWIVCGYSGDNDPVFDHLAAVPSFGRNLYWIGYKDAPPSEPVQKRLLIEEKYAFYIPGYDADTFFVELAQILGCFPPEIIAKPFTHLLKVTDLLADFTIGSSTTDLRQVVRTRIQAAIDQFEKGEAGAQGSDELHPDALDAMALVFSGKYDEVLARFHKTHRPSDELRDAAAWALIAQGFDFVGRAKGAVGAEADELWRRAGERYAEALQIKPDKLEALHNWGVALAAQARTKSGEEADALWAAAGEKYAAVLQIKPDNHEALNNWGVALAAQAGTKSGAEADALWAAANEKYATAQQIRPDKHEALNNWGVALAAQAGTKSGKEANALWAAGGEKYAAALQIKPDDAMVLRNWASVLLSRAGTASVEIREALLTSAIDKCERANKSTPGSGSYNLACAYAIRGDLDACHQWLLDSRDHGQLPSKDHLLSDPDLATVRDLPWFAGLLG